MNKADCINFRIKRIREELNLTQNELAKKIGVSQRTISWSEQPGNNVSDSTIKSICGIFRVNENFLINGIPPMFIEEDSFDLVQFVRDHGGSELEIEIMKAYFELDASTRQYIIEHFKKRLSPLFMKTENRKADMESLETELQHAKVTAAEDEYIKNRLNSAKKTISSASSTITVKDIKNNSNLA